MEQTLNNISAEELFGTTSRLVEQVESNALAGIASLGGAYQAATGVVALLFIFILVRYFDLFRHLVVSSISKQGNRSDIHIYSSELKNIEIVITHSDIVEDLFSTSLLSKPLAKSPPLS